MRAATTSSPALHSRADTLPIDLPAGVDANRARLAWRQLRIGPDGRYLMRLPGQRAQLRGGALLAAAVTGVAAAGLVPSWVAAVAIAIVAGAALAVAARADVSRRRLRWAIEAAAACDRRHGTVVTAKRLAAADGDLLLATKLLSDRAAMGLAGPRPAPVGHDLGVVLAGPERTPATS